MDAKRIAIFGSTGSIGTSALEVAKAAEGRLQVVALSTHRRLAQAVAQARRFRPRWLIASDTEEAARFDWSGLPDETELRTGPEALVEIAASDEVDVLLAAIVGSAGLRSTWAAVAAGKRVALANKEPLVMAGPLICALARASGSEILPVDSEHSAIFQALSAGRHEDVRRLLLTASGGPFRDYTPAQLETVTTSQALAHPTWDMGPKITIDSATMMNKALEIIEARWLFDIPSQNIEVVIHPQSIVHSMVEFADGSVVAQLSPPDMKLPIQYALTYPARWPSPAASLDWGQSLRLEFEPPDPKRFPALELGHQVARVGGTAGAVVNAANEAAVTAFINGQLRFTEIVPACQTVLAEHHFDANPTLDELLRLDQWAREEVSKWVCT